MPNNSDVEKRWACIRDGKVKQVIVWDGVQEWAPANTYTMVEIVDGVSAGIEWDYVDGEFVDNRPVEDFEDETNETE
jgi:hypothetical protein